MQRVGAHHCPTVAEPTRQLPCITHAWQQYVGVGITSHHPFFSHLFPGAKEDRGYVSCHRSLPPEWPSGHSAVHDGNPGITQVVHQREQMDCVHRYIGCIYAHLHCKACTEIPVVHGQWSNVLVQLGHLPSGIYQGGQVASKGQAPCLPELLVYLHLIPRTGQNSCQFGPTSVAAPRLGDQFQQVWFITQPAVQFHCHAIQYVHLHCDTSAQNGVKIQNTLEIAPSRHRQGSPQNFGHFDLYVQPSAQRSAQPPRPIQWWASEAWCQETGSWSDRISVTLTILHEAAWWSSPAVLQGVSLSALEAEITLFTDASSHRWGHSWAPISCNGHCPGSRQTSTSICWRWRQCSRV